MLSLSNATPDWDCKDCVKGMVKETGEKNEDRTINWTDKSCKVAKEQVEDKHCKDPCKEEDMSYEDAAPNCKKKTEESVDTDTNENEESEDTNEESDDANKGSDAFRARASRFLVSVTVGVFIMAVVL